MCSMNDIICYLISLPVGSHTAIYTIIPYVNAVAMEMGWNMPSQKDTYC